MQKFNVTGMSCAACSARVEKAVSKVEGVQKCSVNLLAETMSVEGTAADDKIISAVVNAGYGASVQNEEELYSAKNKDTEKQEINRIGRRLVSSAVILILLMYITMGYGMFGFPMPSFLANNSFVLYLLQPVLAGAVLIINRKFFINGTKAIVSLAPNMDSLVALGSGVSYIYSMYVLVSMFIHKAGGSSVHGEHLYFESAAMVVTLITLGKYLEAISKGKTTSAVKSLMKLVPDFANVIRDGNEVKVKTSDLVKGDVIVLRSGNQIPADGILIEGNISADESSLTGESMPVEKGTGSKVFASTLCVNGFAKIRAEKTGQDTGFAKIIRLVTEASSLKAPVQRIADKVAGVFVPAVILIALLTFAVWFALGRDLFFALNRAVSVLVISCPCALGLATPVAIMAGCGVGAKSGILFKTSAALENAGRIKLIAFDKTGTLTKGVPEVTDVLASENISEDELLILAASVESLSSHPLAKAIAGKAKDKKLYAAEDFKNVQGGGVSAIVKGQKIFGGNAAFIGSCCKEKIDEEKLKALARQGKTPVIFATEEKVLGILALADSLKEDAVYAIKEFVKLGIDSAMITGDNQVTAGAIASRLGIKKIFAEAKPDEKSAIIARLKKEYGRVAMTGDGVNDAVALSGADIGIAIGAGTDVAIDSADLVLVNSRVMDAYNAVALSRKTLAIIHQNLFWAFIYNILLIPLAAGCLYPVLGWTLNPMIAAACMSISSFSVVTNALRLNFFKVKKINKAEGMADKNTVKISVKTETTMQEENTMEKTFNVEGMMCTHCEAHVKEALEKVPGVTEAVADHNAKKATVKLSAPVDDSLLKAAIEGAGYKVV